MPDTTDVREWLRAQGKPVKERGRIPAAMRDEYEEAHRPAAPVVQLAGPDYDAGVSEADFEGPADDDDYVTAAPAPAVEAAGPEPAPRGPQDDAQPQTDEERPRRVATARRHRAKRFTERLWGGPGTPAKRPAKAHKRMSLTGLAEDAFLDLAWTFQGLPPMEKILYLQAPLAGQVVEDTFKGTAVDRILQPAARFDRQFKAVEALTAPAWVMAIITRGRKTPDGDYSPETKLMFSGLRHALLSMSRLATVDFESLKAKSEDLRSASGQIDAMIAWIFEMPGMSEDDMAAAEAAAQAAANGG